MLKVTGAAEPEIVYPESDGQPMADNTKQFMWIVKLHSNLAALYQDNPDVFVCGNQFWYPCKGKPEVCTAPDVYVVFGRPKGHRGSWKQWEENDVPLTVVFETLSPNNTAEEIANKFHFYDEHRVQAYYLYDPDTDSLTASVRDQATLCQTRVKREFVSPLLGVRFDLTGEEMRVFHPNGRPFLTAEELAAEVEAMQRARRLAELAERVLLQQASPEDIQELKKLAGKSVTT